MKKFSAPPMIIILDVLFVVLFVLVLEQSPDLQIVLPKNTILEDTVVVGLDKNNEIAHWFDRKEDRWREKDELTVKDATFPFVMGNTKCKENIVCRDVPPPPMEETKKIYIKDNLAKNISALISDSCLKFPKQCSNVTYYVTDKGIVDKERLKKDYQIFRFILR
jgi:hypothetical protein